MIIRAKMLFGRVNINVIKVEDNVPRVLKERIVRSLRELSAEAYDWESELGLLVATSDIRYSRTRFPLLYATQSCLQRHVMGSSLVVYVLE